MLPLSHSTRFHGRESPDDSGLGQRAVACGLHPPSGGRIRPSRGSWPNSCSTLAQNNAMQWTRGHRHAWWRARGPRAIDRRRSVYLGIET
jgi:hypothetical protein